MWLEGHWARDMLHEIRRIADAQQRIAAYLESLRQGHTTIQSQVVEEPPMPVDHMPDFTLPSTTVRARLDVVGPKLADGSYAVNPSWSSSDDNVLPLEPIADSVATNPDTGDPILDENGNQIPVYSTYANTPLSPEPGEKVGGTVTWRAAGMFDVDIKVIYGDPALGHAAITAGQAAE